MTTSYQSLVSTMVERYCKEPLTALFLEVFPNGKEIFALENEILKMAESDPKKATILNEECPNLINKFEEYKGAQSIIKFKKAVSENIKSTFKQFLELIVKKTTIHILYEKDLASIQKALLEKTSIEEIQKSVYPSKNDKNAKKTCDKFDPNLPPLRYKINDSGLRYEVDCIACKKIHEVQYQAESTSVHYKRLNDLFIIYSTPCVKCNLYPKKWNTKLVLHSDFTNKCILCKKCAISMLRVHCNSAIIGNKQYLEYFCCCGKLAKDSLCISALLAGELCRHHYTFNQEDKKKLLCIECGDTNNVDSSTTPEYRCKKCTSGQQ